MVATVQGLEMVLSSMVTMLAMRMFMLMVLVLWFKLWLLVLFKEVSTLGNT